MSDVMTDVVFRPFGERALFADVSPSGGPGLAAARARELALAIRHAFPRADVVVGGASVLVEPNGEPVDLAALERAATGGSSLAPTPLGERREHVIEVIYDGEDLADVARATGLAVEEVIRRHAERAYEVEVIGFLPGFAYLGEVDPSLVLARRATPRKRVPANAVAIAGRYAGIYPTPSPGGWNLLGTAVSPSLFEPTRDPPARFAVGDRVRFQAARSSDRVSAASPRPADAPVPRGPHALEIVRCPPHASVQDLGRRGRKSEGIPASGAWDVETHVLANRALGNRDSDATVELPWGSFAARALRDVWTSVDGAAARLVRAGDLIEIAPHERAVRYLAVEGGVDVPLVLGSRSTLLSVGLGGFAGRRLQRGDRLAAVGGDAPSRLASPVGAIARAGEVEDAGVGVTELRVVPGPDVARFPSGSFERFLDGELSISHALDRTGTRLEGVKLARSDEDRGAPAPTIRGAIQVSTDGTPIVLGPDAATTGGYPVVAVLVEASHGTFARLRPGRPVRFRLAEGHAKGS